MPKRGTYIVPSTLSFWWAIRIMCFFLFLNTLNGIESDSTSQIGQIWSAKNVNTCISNGLLYQSRLHKGAQLVCFCLSAMETSINDVPCFLPFLTYLPTLSYSITSDFVGYLGTPLQTLILGVINGRSPSLYCIFFYQL
jgi:hypothetical protein